MNKNNGRGREISIGYIDIPLGRMIAGATGNGICMLEYPDYHALEADMRRLAASLGGVFVERESPLLDALHRQLTEYFDGTRREFDLPLELSGTDFQRRAWRALQQIPYGATSTYAAQAASMGCQSAVRAVANANGRNRISIILPCHRIIGSDGSLTGYGGGLWRKERLLELERNYCNR
jgi:AraC family transcriptional regulator of adaptative response/methylated-DNA-[protein]-cysteine methyltransferase